MPIKKNPYARKKTPPPERGTIFTKETDDPTESLYIMDKMLETMPPMQDPSAKYSLNQDRKPEMVSALEARNIFVYRLFLLFLNSGMSGAAEIRDFVLHRAAFLFAEQPWQSLIDAGCDPKWTTPEEFVTIVQNRYRDTPKKKDGKTTLYGIVSGMIGDVFLALGYGWNYETHLQTWSGESRRRGKGNERVYLFPSLKKATVETIINAFNLGVIQTYAEETGKGVGYHKRTVVRNVQETLDKQVLEFEKQADAVRRDEARRSGDPGEAVLSRIAEKISEGAYNHWFKDAECRVDTANKELVFSARTDFTVKSINRHFTAAMDETTRELGYVDEEGKLWTRRMIVRAEQPALTREQEIAEMRKLSASCNAEGRERKKPQRPLTIGQLGKKIAQTK